MKQSLWLVLAFSILSLAGCATNGTYPVSGEVCRPDDPVKQLDASDCLPPV
ncbi:hypothetical protein [Pseudogemmobacter sp. W21_MBD1_M6]|uniref:hypothetical protein n=1 Tax=Pseudogemmobacter sp. W21_MBD1_M6 TaxID=3240271 RepID=UPI003F99E141